MPFSHPIANNGSKGQGAKARARTKAMEGDSPQRTDAAKEESETTDTEAQAELVQNKERRAKAASQGPLGRGL